MKKVLQLLVCFLHPVAVILIWLDLMRRTDLTPGAKAVWAVAVIIPVMPFFYVLVSGNLW